MKNQYLGDINDYRKQGLLRLLSGMGELKTGVCWMLTPDDGRTNRKGLQMNSLIRMSSVVLLVLTCGACTSTPVSPSPQAEVETSQSITVEADVSGGRDVVVLEAPENAFVKPDSLMLVDIFLRYDLILGSFLNVSI